jgi:hypothetical protein
MPLGLGISKGLSYVNDWDKDIDRVYQREEYAAQVRAEKERKTQYYAGLLKQGHATNPRTEQELTEYYKGLNNELADFVISNPNFETDVNSMQKFLDISDRYLDNNILRTDLQVKQEFDKLSEAVSTGKITTTQFDREMERYNTYIDPNQKGDPYVFSNPKLKTTGELVGEMSQLVETIEGSTLEDPVSHTFYTRSEVDPEKALQIVEGHYADEENKVVMDSTYNNLVKNNPELKTMFPDVKSFYAKQLINSKRSDRTTIGPDYEYQQRMQLQYSKKAGTDNLFSHFLMNELPNIQSTNVDQNYVTPNAGIGRAPASSPAIAFTVMKDFKKPTSISMADGAHVMTENSSVLPFSDKISAQATNVKGYVNIGGTLYIETEIVFNNGETIGMGAESEGKNIDDNKLKSYGFIHDEKTGVPIYNDVGNQVGYSKGATWKGSILLPANINAGTVTEFEHNASGSVEHVSKIAPVLSQIMNSEINRSPVLLRNEIKQKMGIDIGTGISNLKQNDELSKKEGSPIYTVTHNNEEVIIDLKTGDLYNINK